VEQHVVPVVVAVQKGGKVAVRLIFGKGAGADSLQQESWLLEVLLPQSLDGGPESGVCPLEELLLLPVVELVEPIESHAIEDIKDALS